MIEENSSLNDQLTKANATITELKNQASAKVNTDTKKDTDDDKETDKKDDKTTDKKDDKSSGSEETSEKKNTSKDEE